MPRPISWIALVEAVDWLNWLLDACWNAAENSFKTCIIFPCVSGYICWGYIDCCARCGICCNACCIIHYCDACGAIIHCCGACGIIHCCDACCVAIICSEEGGCCARCGADACCVVGGCDSRECIPPFCFFVIMYIERVINMLWRVCGIRFQLVETTLVYNIYRKT